MSFGSGGGGSDYSGGFGGPRIGRHLNEEDNKQFDWKAVEFWRIMKLFKSYRYQFLFIFILVVIGNVLALAPPIFMKYIIDEAIPSGDIWLLSYLVAGMVLLPLVGGLLGVWQNHSNVKVGQGVMKDLRYSLFMQLQKQSMLFFIRTSSGEIIQRISGDVQAVRDIITRFIVQTVTHIVTVVATVTLLLILNWKLALIGMVIIPLFLLPIRKVARIRRKLRLETQKAQGTMSAHLSEVFGISGAMLTKIFGKEDFQEQRFNAVNQKVMNLELKLNLIGRWFMMFVSLLAPLGIAIIYFFGGYGVITEEVSVGDLVAFAALLGGLYMPVSGLLNLHVEIAASMAIFQRIFEYQDMKPDIVDEPGAVELKEVKGAITFEHVRFAYPEKEEVIKEVSFHIESGQVVALVGPSGSGKTTLSNLVARLFDPQKGSIFIDGLNLKHIKIDSLRQHIAVVTQEPFLFNATVKENLLFAKEDATHEEIIEACRKAYIHDFVASLPEGYETMLGERGYKLSGGERQRLAIARAILRDPRILILDEATSHLDSKSEAYVQAALEELMVDRTSLVIAHRLSTILSADKILVLENGKLVEEGTHQTLYNRKGLYAKLYETQFSKTEGGERQLGL
jgi:ATP-binding cassette subfamily B protein